MSVAHHTLGDDDVSQILTQSRSNNLRVGLTGALLHQPGKFIQILEGPEEDVVRAFRTISADPRHRSIHMVSRETIDKRQFADWTMGYRSLSGEEVTRLGEFDDLFRRSSTGENTDPEAQSFLAWLDEYWFAAKK